MRPVATNDGRATAGKTGGWWMLAKGAAALACLGLLARALASADWSAAAERLRGAGALAFLVLLPFPLALLLDASAWRLLLGASGARVSLARLFRVRVSTEALTTALPAGGLLAEALGPILLAPETPVASSLASSATKRWLIIRTHGYYVALAVALGYGVLATTSRALLHDTWLPWIVLATAAGLVGLSVALESATTRLGIASRAHDAVQRLRGSRVLAWLRRDGGADEDDLRAAFARVDAELARLGRTAHPAPSALILGAWLLESCETFLILRVLGAPVGFVEVLAFDAALSVVRTVALFAPAGLGVQDLGYLAFFTALGLPHPEALGPAFLILKRTKELFYVSLGFTLLAFTRSAAKRARRAAANSAPDGDTTLEPSP